MRRTITKKAFAVYTIAFLLIACFAIYVHGVRRVDPQILNRLISQTLPAGTDESKVIAFLDAHHISHSEYSPELGRIFAYVPKSYVGLFHGFIHIEFKFDENGRLLKYELRELFETL